VQGAKFRPCEDDTVAVDDEELGAHAAEKYASIGDWARCIFANRGANREK
jgi:hypothetical protein